MQELMFQSGASVPAGTKLSLTFEQADARKQLLVADDPKDVAKAVEDLVLAKRAVAAASASKDAGELAKAEKFLTDARENLQKRRGYTATASLFFKKGEVIRIERTGTEFGRALTEALGIQPADRPAAVRAAERAPRAPRSPRGRGK